MRARASFKYSIFALLIASVSDPAGAIQFETGKWQVTMKSRNPLTGDPITETTFDCIQDNNFDPAQAMMDDGNCRILDKQESNNKVTWKIECGGGNMPVFHGEGSFVSHGSSAEGEMTMTMTMGANTMEMHNQWQGKKVSSKCDGM